jgi:hypothetical protein
MSSRVFPDLEPPASMICVAGEASRALASSCLAVRANIEGREIALGEVLLEVRDDRLQVFDLGL